MYYKRKLSFLFLTGLFVFWIMGLLPQSAFAQNTNSLDLTVSPYTIELTNVPGSKIQSKFRIRNNTDTPINLQISIGKLSTDDQQNSVTIQDIVPTDDFKSWITFSQASISARPKEWTDVAYTIAIPKTAAFGYYYAIRIKQAQPTDTTGHPTTKVRGEILIPLLLDVKKAGAMATVSLLDFKPTQFINEYLPISFTIRVKNTGNVRVQPKGNIFIKTGNDNDMGVLDINGANGNILPNGTRVFTATWDDGFLINEPVTEDDGTVRLDKNGKPMTHLVINWNNLTHFRIGKFTANLLLAYDNGSKDVPIEASTTFWVFPYTIIGIAVVSIIAIIVIIRLLILLTIKRALKKYKNMK